MTEAAVDKSKFGGEEPLSIAQYKYFDFSVRSLVGGVILGVVMTIINAGIMERVDTALTGGTWFPFAGGTHSIVSMISNIFFGLPGAWLTGLTNALFAVITGSTPVAAGFIFNNLLYPVVAIIFTRMWSMRQWWHWVVALIPIVFIGYAPMTWFVHSIFQLPWMLTIQFQSLTNVAAIILAAIFGKLIAEGIHKSGVIN
jgi:hypothetical protein